PEVHLLNAELDEARTDPEVCDAVEELDVEYALDFGPQEIHGRSATYTGLNEISETGAAEVGRQVGDAQLLRMLPCRGTDGSMTPCLITPPLRPPAPGPRRWTWASSSPPPRPPSTPCRRPRAGCARRASPRCRSPRPGPLRTSPGRAT